MPSWTWIEDGPELTEAQQDARRPVLDRLCNQINQMDTEDERRGWARQAAWENPGEYDGPEFDTDEEREASEIEGRLRREQRQAQREMLEAQLNGLGARMMRPYEHWNEDEAYMQYMENRYD